MKSKINLVRFIEKILGELNKLSDDDVSKIENDDYLISLKIVKIKAQPETKNEISELQKNDILRKLQECRTREEGYDYLSNLLKSKKELEVFARFLDISILKQDKADQIKEKIIEATVGAIIRSNAIQGSTKQQRGLEN